MNGPVSADFGDDIFVLLALEGAGGINKDAARGKAGQCVAEDGHLAGVKVVKILGLQAPLDFGVPAEGTGTGTRGVNEDALEGRGERQGLGGVESDTLAGEVGEGVQAVEVEIAGDGIGSSFNGLSGLVAGSGADIEEGLAGLNAEQGNDGLRAYVLGPAGGSGVKLGGLEGGFGNTGGYGRAELAVPAFKEPGGAGESSGAIGPGDAFAWSAAEDGVDETSGGAFACRAGQLNRFGYGGVLGDALEMAELIEAEAEGDADLDIELARDELGNDEVELRLAAENAEDKLPGEAGIAVIERSGVGGEKFGSPRVGFDTLEDLEGSAAGGVHLRSPSQALGVAPMVRRNIWTNAPGWR